MALTPIGFEVLLTLADGPQHGYGIKLAIEHRTDGALSLGSGTLYQAIYRLEREGMIAAVGRVGRRYSRALISIVSVGMAVKPSPPTPPPCAGEGRTAEAGVRLGGRKPPSPRARGQAKRGGGVRGP